MGLLGFRLAWQAASLSVTASAAEKEKKQYKAYFREPLNNKPPMPVAA